MSNDTFHELPPRKVVGRARAERPLVRLERLNAFMRKAGVKSPYECASDPIRKGVGRSRQRTRIFIVFVLVVTFACGWVIGFSWRPLYPESWDRIELGMPASEAIKLEPRLSSEMREVKGFDQVIIDFGDRAWTLIVGIDANANVVSVGKYYTFKPCGLWNKTIYLGNQ